MHWLFLNGVFIDIYAFPIHSPGYANYFTVTMYCLKNIFVSFRCTTLLFDICVQYKLITPKVQLLSITCNWTSSPFFLTLQPLPLCTHWFVLCTYEFCFILFVHFKKDFTYSEIIWHILSFFSDLFHLTLCHKWPDFILFFYG